MEKTVGGKYMKKTECKVVQLLWKTVWKSLKKQNIDLTYNPSVPLPVIYPGRKKTYVCPKTYT